MENDKNNDFYCIVQSPSFFSMKVEVVVLLPRASFVALDCTYVQHVGMFLNGKSRRWCSNNKENLITKSDTANYK